MFYVATSPAAALLESVLRHPVMVPGRRIDLSAAKLRGNTLSALHLLKPVPCVPLMMPERGLVVTDPRKEEEWRRILTTTRHADTHEAAADVAIQFASHSGDPPLTLAGFGYPSQQHSRSLVYLLYEPPTESRSWRIERSTDLESVEGRREAVTSAGGYRTTGVCRGAGCRRPRVRSARVRRLMRPDSDISFDHELYATRATFFARRRPLFQIS